MKATIVFQRNWEAIDARNPDGSRRYRYIINKGSSRSSKTFSLIDCYDLYARRYENKRLTVWRDTKTDCKKTVLNDTLKHLKRTGRYLLAQDFNKTESIFTYNTGSTFEIHGTDDEETVHGLTQDAAWFNEPYKVGLDTFNQIDQRTADFVFIDWNPKKAHWIEDLEKDPRTLVIHSTFKDNPFCPEEQRIKILSYQPVKWSAVVLEKIMTENEAGQYDLLTNPRNLSVKHLKELIRCRENEAKKSASDFNWCVYGLGTKAERPNRIFHWEEISLELYRAINAPVVYGVDWGAVDPWAIVEGKYYDGALYLRERNYKSENLWRQEMTDTERAMVSGNETENPDGGGIVKWLFAKLDIDRESPIVCDTNRPLKIAALRRGGWNAYPAMKGPGSILDGIDTLNNMPVYYTSDSENLGYEQENYSRKADHYGVVLEEPEDVNNHCVDSARYIAQYLVAQSLIERL